MTVTGQNCRLETKCDLLVLTNSSAHPAQTFLRPMNVSADCSIKYIFHAFISVYEACEYKVSTSD